MKLKGLNKWLLLFLITLLTSTFSFGINNSINSKYYSENRQESTVYITKTGKKYHVTSCGYLRQSKISIGKNDAISRGYTPCSKCRP